MRYTLMVRVLGDEAFTSFDSEQSADNAADLIKRLMPSAFTKVEREVPPLNYWHPDEADRMVLPVIRRGNIITAIKYARLKSGAGLKEAKDWVDANYPAE